MYEFINEYVFAYIYTYNIRAYRFHSDAIFFWKTLDSRWHVFSSLEKFILYINIVENVDIK